VALRRISALLDPLLLQPRSVLDPLYLALNLNPDDGELRVGVWEIQR
jgi:hypothetical protein